MTAVVVDASALMGWVLGEAPLIERAVEQVIQQRAAHPMRAPSLIVLETANALQTAVRRGRLSPAQAQQAAGLFDALSLQLDAGTPSTTEALGAATQHGLTAYDAEYLRLAMRTGAALLSGDRALRAAAIRQGVTVLPE